MIINKLKSAAPLLFFLLLPGCATRPPAMINQENYEKLSCAEIANEIPVVQANYESERDSGEWGFFDSILAFASVAAGGYAASKGNEEVKQSAIDAAGSLDDINEGHIDKARVLSDRIDHLVQLQAGKCSK